MGTGEGKGGITRPLKFYSIRHAATTALISAGNDPRTVCGITGNTLEAMLLHYFQSSNQLRTAAVEGMPDITRKHALKKSPASFQSSPTHEGSDTAILECADAG